MAGGLIMFQQLLEGLGGRAASHWVDSLRHIIAGGSNHTGEIDRQIMEVLRPEMYLFGYGMTESTSFIACTRETHRTLEKPLNVGYPMWYLDWRLVDEHDRDVPQGEQGELLVRGPTISPGYFGGHSSVKPAHQDGGWFRTGDVLRCDADGAFFFVDRTKDMIRSGGLNVYAAEVEQAIMLAASDVVSDVAVVGATSLRWGEAVVAYVVPAPSVAGFDADALRQRLREQIGRYKIPKAVFEVDRLPRDLLGKVDKKALRQGLEGTVID